MTKALSAQSIAAKILYQDQTSGTSAINATGVDLRGTDFVGANSLALVWSAAFASGTSAACACKLQDSDDDSTYTDISGATFTSAGASGSVCEVAHVTLLGASRKRYLRAVLTPSGTSPVYDAAVLLLIGDYTHTTRSDCKFAV